MRAASKLFYKIARVGLSELPYLLFFVFFDGLADAIFSLESKVRK